MRFSVRVCTILACTATIIAIVFAPAARAGPDGFQGMTAFPTERKLARTPDGILYVALVGNNSGSPRVAVLETRDGARWDPLPNPTSPERSSDRATLAIDGTGRLHLSWTEDTESGRQVFYASYDGDAWSAREQLSHSVGYAGYPSVAVDASDRVHVAWYATDGLYYQIFYRRWEAGSWTPERALTHTSQDATNPAIALSPNGSVHLAWARMGQRAFTEIAYMRIRGDEVEDYRVISEGQVSAFSPSLVVAKNDTVYAVWSSTGVIQFVVRTNTWSPGETISPPTLIARNPSLALDGRGNLHVAWEANDGNVYYQTRNGTQNGTWTLPGRLTSEGVNTYPGIRWSQFGDPMCGPTSQIDIVWTRELGGTSQLGYWSSDSPAPCPAARASDSHTVPIVAAIAMGTLFLALVLGLRARARRRGN